MYAAPQDAKFLDDLLKRGNPAFAQLPSVLFLNSELCVLLEAMEREANTGGFPDGTEAGTLLGFTSAEGGLTGLDVRCHDGEAFNPAVFLPPNVTDYKRVALGFSYQGTVHTHTRREQTDPLASFSGYDVLTFVRGFYQERVSLMICRDLVHVLVGCGDQIQLTEGELLPDMVEQSLTEALADREGTLEIDDNDIREYAKGAMSMAAVMEAAKKAHVGYYIGKTGDELRLINR
jgi:hypothetical protein